LGDCPSEVCGSALHDLGRCTEALDLLGLQANPHPSPDHTNGRWRRSRSQHGFLERMSYVEVGRSGQSMGDHAGLQGHDWTTVRKRRADVFTDACNIHREAFSQ
jgi:hypothetical protein